MIPWSVARAPCPIIIAALVKRREGEVASEATQKPVELYTERERGVSLGQTGSLG